MSEPVITARTVARDEISRCRACGGEIIWVRMAKSGKRNPLDREPVPNGNVVLDQHGEGVTLTRKERETMPPPRYQSHFASCPEARRFRRKP